jgi:hypothetical protein
MDAFAK